MSTTCEKSPEVNAKPRNATHLVRFVTFDRRQEDVCGCKEQCWLAKNSPNVLTNHKSGQILEVIKCRQLCQMRQGVLEGEAA